MSFINALVIVFTFKHIYTYFLQFNQRIDMTQMIVLKMKIQNSSSYVLCPAITSNFETLKQNNMEAY